MRVAEVFKAVGLSPCGPVPWLTKISERTAGVYVVALVADANFGCQVYADYLSSSNRQRWLPNEPIVYVGATKCKQGLAGRIEAFYRHKHGKRSPHRGGQDVKLLKCSLWVYWSSAMDAFGCEDRMLAVFRERVGQPPFANRG